MTDSFVTQCPHCQTRFRVTGAQLGIAGGSVRCGACLLVFNAAEQLASAESLATPEPQEQPMPAAAGQAARPSAQPPADSPFASQSPLRDAPPAAPASLSLNSDYRPPLQVFRPDAGTFRPETPIQATYLGDSSEPAATPAAETPPVRTAPRTRRAPQPDWDKVELDLEQLSAALASLPADQQPLSPPPRRKPAAAAATAPAATPAPAAAPAPASTSEPAAAPAASPAHSEDPASVPADAGLSARRDEPPASPAAAPRPQALDEEPDAAPDGRSEPHIGDERIDDDEPPAPAAGPAEREADEPLVSGLRAGDDDDPLRPVNLGPIHESLVNLSADPLQLQWPEQRRNPWRALVWLLLCLLALGGLAAQYLYFNFDHLARHPQFRPWFEQACPHLGCQMPSRVDIEQIRSSNLTVRNHPSQPGALKIDAIIYNRADFVQPFPLLELSFEDMNNLVLAQRSFRPAEYLGGELAGSRDMPPQTPIHIALEVVDPGTQATNYRLAFKSPD